MQPGPSGSGSNAPVVNAGTPAGKKLGTVGGEQSKSPVGIAGSKKEPDVKPPVGPKPPDRPDVRPVYGERPYEIKTPESGGGHRHYDPKTNTTVHTDPKGRITSIETAGTKARDFGPDGHAAHIERTRADGSRMIVDRGMHGERWIENVRPGGVRVVAVGRRGFVERTVRPGYISRTYVVGGRTRVIVYRSYAYRGIPYYRYVPRVYYAPAFYGWAYHPWDVRGVPVVYAWGWGPAPIWFYGGYFAPAPYYPDPTLWLTDYLLAENLKLAYENQQAPPPSSPGAVTPEQMQLMKQMIAQEVQQQIQAEQAAAVGPAPPAPAPSGPTPTEAAPPALDPKQRTFVVSASLEVTADATNCTLTGGDIIYRSGELQKDGKVGVTILSSKPGDCKTNSSTAVELVALQDMQNQFREQIAAGMEALASSQGKNGLPTGPAAGPIPAPDGQAQPAPDAQTLLAQLNDEATQTENEIKQAANGGA
jgi:hypothetical protein